MLEYSISQVCSLRPPCTGLKFWLKFNSQNHTTQITKFMGPTWGPPGSCRPQMGPMLSPRTLLSGKSSNWHISKCIRLDSYTPPHHAPPHPHPRPHPITVLTNARVPQVPHWAAMTKSSVHIGSLFLCACRSIVDQFTVKSDQQTTWIMTLSHKSDESYADFTKVGLVTLALHWVWPEPQQ